MSENQHFPTIVPTNTYTTILTENKNGIMIPECDWTSRCITLKKGLDKYNKEVTK